MSKRHRAPADITHATLSVLFLALLVVGTFWVLRPFLTSMLWALIVCITMWPIFKRLDDTVGGRRWLAVLIMMLTIVLAVFVPVTLALVTIVDNARNITEEIKSLESLSLPSAPAWLGRVPFGGAGFAAEWSRFVALDAQQRAAALTPYAHAALQWFAVAAGSIGSMLLQFLLATIIAAIGFTRGEHVRDGILRFATRLGGQQGYDAAVLAARTIRGVVVGVVLTALVQAAIGGVGLFIAGVPAAALLTAVMLFLCLAQIGPLPVLMLAVIWLFSSGQTVAGTTLLVIAVLAGTLDNVVRPLLIKRGANLPLVLIFSGVIGGLIAFGIIGLFIGPVVLSAAYTLLASWVSAEREGAPAATPEELA